MGEKVFCKQTADWWLKEFLDRKIPAQNWIPHTQTHLFYIASMSGKIGLQVDLISARCDRFLVQQLSTHFQNHKKWQKSGKKWKNNRILTIWDLILFGRNYVNETVRLGIIAHCLWEQNLGNVTEVFVNDFFRFIARSLWFRCPKFIPNEKIVSQNHYFLR